MPSIKDLGKDRQWRVRLAVLECLPVLAQHLGEVHFTKEMNPLLHGWLLDPVFSVREAAASSVRAISDVLGQPWAEASLIPQLQAMLAERNYLFRISAMLCAKTLAGAVSLDFLEKHIVP